MRRVAIARAGNWPEGRLAPIEVGEMRIGLCRIAGTFFAFNDHCPHVGRSLALGTLRDTAIECPRHDMLRRVTDGAALTAGCPLIIYRTAIEGGDVIVELPAEPRPVNV